MSQKCSKIVEVRNLLDNGITPVYTRRTAMVVKDLIERQAKGDSLDHCRFGSSGQCIHCEHHRPAVRY